MTEKDAQTMLVLDKIGAEYKKLVGDGFSIELNSISKENAEILFTHLKQGEKPVAKEVINYDFGGNFKVTIETNKPKYMEAFKEKLFKEDGLKIKK